MSDTFSNRHGYKGPDKEITVREDAPQGLRFAIPLLAQDAGLATKQIRQTICNVLLLRPDPSNWSDFPNVWDELNNLIGDCEWFKVYDIAEAVYADLSKRFGGDESSFEERLNSYFLENGIGWQMADGKIMYRGSESFSEITRDTVTVLTRSGRSAASNEIHEALKDISRRPRPDVTGAIQHAMAALECTARDVTGKSNATLGKIIPDLGLPPPLDKAVDKLWGYASDRARHIREGSSVTTTEAELVVSVACATCTFLSRIDDEKQR